MGPFPKWRLLRSGTLKHLTQQAMCTQMRELLQIKGGHASVQRERRGQEAPVERLWMQFKKRWCRWAGPRRDESWGRRCSPRTHLRSREIYVVGFDHEGLGVNLAQTLPQFRVLG